MKIVLNKLKVDNHKVNYYDNYTFLCFPFLETQWQLGQCIVLFLFTLLFSVNTKAQETLKPKFQNGQVAYSFHIGKIVPHRTYFRPKISGVTFIHEISYVKQTDKFSKWAKFYDFPLTGISLAYIDLSNNNVFGQAVGVLPFINFRKRKEYLNYNIKIGVGLAYFTKTFDEINNYTNNAIGGHFTNYTRFAFGLNKKISKKIDTNIDFSLTHFSNGNTEQPNLGINIISGKIGLVYNIKTVENSFKKTELNSKAFKKYSYFINFGLGFSSVVVNGGPNYPVWVFSGFVAKKHAVKGAYTLGFDFEKHEAVERLIINQEHEYNNLFFASSKVTLLAGYNFIFPHFNYHAQIGTYIFNPNVQKGNVVVKLNAFYHFKNQYEPQKINPYIGVSLKSHYFSADFVQLVLGVAF